MKTMNKTVDERVEDYSLHTHTETQDEPLSQVIWQRLKTFNTIFDNRFEDLTRDSWLKTTYRDLSAGLIVALTAIPMAMGFAMAMGLRPEQGIIAGALACIIGRTWGGSKYQVYGPTAAFIPIIAALMEKYGEASGGSFAEAHGFLVFVSLIAGLILMLMGVFGLGKYAKLVPNSIIVGFTVGIAVAIAFSNIESVLGIEDFKDLLGEDEDLTGGLLHNLALALSNLDKINIWSVALGLMTFILTKGLLRISIFIPAPLLAIAASTGLAMTVLADKGVILVRDIYGSIPNHFFVFTPPVIPEMTNQVVIDILYFVSAIVFVSAVESLLCSSMADRLADNRKTPFNPDKEFWGQGLVQAIVPLINGFPCTGALARTATSIKAGAVTPLAGYFKGILKLALAYYIARYLELVPMACIGGILLWVASNMIKVSEIKEVLAHNNFHASLMVFTAIMVPATDFLTGVLSSLIIYFVARKFLDTPVSTHKTHAQTPVVAHAQTHTTTLGHFNCVTVALTMTDYDQQLLTYVAHLAELGISQKFHFIHVMTKQDKALGLSVTDMKKTLQQKVSAQFGTHSQTLSLQTQVMEGINRIDGIIQYSLVEKADLVLLGHRKNRTGLRSVAQRLAMLSSCSVWMVPEDAGTNIQRILVPIDFSRASADTLSQATALAKTSHIPECLALHVFFDKSVIRYEEHEEIVQGDEWASFNKFMATIDTHDIRVKPSFHESINIARTIILEAEQNQADLIVIGIRGHSQAAAILLGSVTAQVLTESKIPVLAVHHSDDKLLLRETLLSSRFWTRSDLKTN